jgi:hypothetical protein
MECVNKSFKQQYRLLFDSTARAVDKPCPLSRLLIDLLQKQPAGGRLRRSLIVLRGISAKNIAEQRGECSD